MELYSGHGFFHCHQYWVAGHLWRGFSCPTSETVEDFISIQLFQIGALLQPSSCYFVFSSVAVIGTVVILVFVPETRGKTRAQVAELFKGKVARTEEGGRINQGANTSF